MTGRIIQEPFLPGAVLTGCRAAGVGPFAAVKPGPELNRPHHPIDEDAGRGYQFRVQAPRFEDFVDFGDA